MKRLITMLICLLAATHAKAENGKFPLSQAAIYTVADDFTVVQIEGRIARWRAISAHADELSHRILERLKDAYFELIHYPVRGLFCICQ